MIYEIKWRDGEHQYLSYIEFNLKYKMQNI